VEERSGKMGSGSLHLTADIGGADLGVKNLGTARFCQVRKDTLSELGWTSLAWG
jgi:hypothetical protein